MKKTLMLSAAALALFAMLGTSSCKKDDDNGSKSRHDMMIGTWTLSKMGADANNNKSVDAGEVAAASLAGVSGTTKFNSDGTGSATITIANSPSTTDFKWTLINGDADIQEIDGTDTTVVHLISIDNNNATILDPNTGLANGAWYIFTK